MPGNWARGQYLVHLQKLGFFVLKFSRSLYLCNHLSESIHSWTKGTLSKHTHPIPPQPTPPLPYPTPTPPHPTLPYLYRGARWPGGKSLGLWIQRSGVRAPLGSNRVVSLSKAHLLPKSTGNTQKAVAPPQHD